MPKINGYTLPTFHHPDTKLKLYAHQVETLDNWNKESLMLITKTGSGKTVSFVLPLILKGQSAICIYPTNALISDQLLSYKFILGIEGITYKVVTPENYKEKRGDETYQIIEINSEILEDYRENVFHFKNNGEVLRELLRLDTKKLILINPDIIYLLLELRYFASAETISHMAGYEAVVIDEFHLYTGLQLVNMLFMLFLCKKMNLFQRYVFLSATPDPLVMKYMNALFHPFVIQQSHHTKYPVAQKNHHIAYTVYLTPEIYGSRDEKRLKILHKIMELYPKAKELQSKNNKTNENGKYVPLMVIVNSVVEAKLLESLIVRMGIPRSDIASVRGLASRKMRDVRGKAIVVGTSAIEVGIDFTIKYLLFEASNAASFLQRFGRAGRHCIGESWLYLKEDMAQAFKLFGDKPIDRKTLESLVMMMYPYQNARAWLTSTFGGMLMVYAQMHYFLQKIEKDSGRDKSGVEEMKTWIYEVASEFAVLVENKYQKQVIPRLNRDWCKDLFSNTSFRSSMPTVSVVDLKDKANGIEDFTYDADISMVLRLGENIRMDDEGKVYIDGLSDKKKKVFFQQTFVNDPDVTDGVFYTTRMYDGKNTAKLLVEGVETPLSSVMCKKDDYHLFFVAPAHIHRFLDWTVTTFPCGIEGDKIIAFDGNAVLLSEIYNKYKYVKLKEQPKKSGEKVEVQIS